MLLNIFYHVTEELVPPEVIRLFSDPAFNRLSDAIVESPEMFRWLYYWQVGEFIRDEEVRAEFLPRLYQQFEATPSARTAFRALNTDLLASLVSNTEEVGRRLAAFSRPVRIVFGEDDPYLNSGVARSLDELFTDPELFLVANARHFVQMDEPAEVARLILATPTGSRD